MSKSADGTEDEVVVLKPSQSILTNMHPDLQHPEISFSSGKNEYHLVELDKEGNEVPGSDFAVGEVTFRTTFANNRNFAVKKNIK